jgi:hypothetical protein
LAPGLGRPGISAILGAFWTGMAVGYHLSFFAEIINAAYLFGGLYLFAAVLFFVEGTIRDRIQLDADVFNAFRW